MATAPDRRSPFTQLLFGGRQFAQGLWETGVAPTTPGPPGSSQNFPKHRLGTLRYLEDGRIFAYALNGAGALTPGMLVQQPIASGNMSAANVLVLAAANVDSVNMTKQVSVNQNASNLAANFYQDGFMYVRNMNNSAANAGCYYKIRSHPATNSNSTNANYFTFTLYDDIQVSLATTSNVALVASPYSQVVIYDHTNTNARPAGISPISVAANAYFWLQVAGPCGAIANAALQAGKSVVPSNLADGSVMGVGGQGVNANTSLPAIGYAIEIGNTGFGCFIYLKIAG